MAFGFPSTMITTHSRTLPNWSSQIFLTPKVVGASRSTFVTWPTSGAPDAATSSASVTLVSLETRTTVMDPCQLTLNDFGYSAGWRLEKHLRFLADVTGFSTSSALVGVMSSSRNKDDGTFQPAQAVINDFYYSAGSWRIEEHPRFVADLTGSKRADVIGFGDAGVYASLNNGNGAFGPVNLVAKDFGYAQGWRVEKHPRVIADVNGDKCGDIVGFGDAGVYISIIKCNGTFQAPKLVIKDFGYVAGGWRVEKHLRFAVDLTGNGCADILGENSVWVSYNSGGGNFGPVQHLFNEFSFSGGWTEAKIVRFRANLYN